MTVRYFLAVNWSRHGWVVQQAERYQRGHWRYLPSVVGPFATKREAVAAKRRILWWMEPFDPNPPWPEFTRTLDPTRKAGMRIKTSGQSRPAEGATTVKKKAAAKKSTKSATKTKTVKRAPAKTSKRAAKGGSRK